MYKVTKISNHAYYCEYNDVLIATIITGINPFTNKRYYDVNGTSGLIKFRQFNLLRNAKSYVKSVCDDLIKGA